MVTVISQLYLLLENVHHGQETLDTLHVFQINLYSWEAATAIFRHVYRKIVNGMSSKLMFCKNVMLLKMFINGLVAAQQHYRTEQGIVTMMIFTIEIMMLQL